MSTLSKLTQSDHKPIYIFTQHPSRWLSQFLVVGYTPGRLTPTRKEAIRREELQGVSSEDLCRTSVIRKKYLEDAQEAIRNDPDCRLQVEADVISITKEGKF